VNKKNRKKKKRKKVFKKKLLIKEVKTEKEKKQEENEKIKEKFLDNYFSDENVPVDFTPSLRPVAQIRKEVLEGIALTQPITKNLENPIEEEMGINYTKVRNYNENEEKKYTTSNEPLSNYSTKIFPLEGNVPNIIEDKLDRLKKEFTQLNPMSSGKTQERMGYTHYDITEKFDPIKSGKTDFERDLKNKKVKYKPVKY